MVINITYTECLESIREEGTNVNVIPTLRSLRIKPIPFILARSLINRNHYLHSLPGGTVLTFGIFLDGLVRGAIVFGVGPFNVYRLVERARPEDCLTLTRLWLSDELPRNSESHVIGMVLHALKQNTNLKFVVTYADPSSSHIGTIYQATNWLYTGLSSATPLYDIGDGILHHSRSLAHGLGTHSISYLSSQGIDVKTVPQSAKHRYICFLDQAWRSRLTVPVLPYPKKENVTDGHC